MSPTSYYMIKNMSNGYWGRLASKTRNIMLCDISVISAIVLGNPRLLAGVGSVLEKWSSPPLTLAIILFSLRIISTCIMNVLRRGV